MSQIPNTNPNNSFHEENDEFLGIDDSIKDQSQNKQQISSQNQHNCENCENEDQQIDSLERETTKLADHQNDGKQRDEEEEKWNNAESCKQDEEKKQSKRCGRRGQQQDGKETETNKSNQGEEKPQKKEDNWDIVEEEVPQNKGRRGGRNNDREPNQIQKDKQSEGSVNKQQNNGRQSERGNRKGRNDNRDGRGNRRNNNGQDNDGDDRNRGGNRDYGKGERNGRQGNDRHNSGGYNGYNRNRNNRDEQGDQNNRSDRRGGQRNYGGGNEMGRNDNQNRNGRNTSEQSNQNNGENQNRLQHEKQVQVKQQIVGQPKVKPSGQRSWPELSIYVKQTKISFTYRQITEHISDILFHVYPNKLINKFTENYRERIKEKKDKFMSENKPVPDGWTYLKQCQSIANFRGVAFLQITQNKQQNPKLLQKALDITKSIKGSNCELQKKQYSILIPYSSELGKISECLKNIIERVEKSKDFKEIILTTNDKKESIEAFQQFTAFVTTLIDENMIAI